MKSLIIILILIVSNLVGYSQDNPRSIKFPTVEPLKEGVLLLNEIIVDDKIIGYFPARIEDWKYIIDRKIIDIKIQPIYMKSMYIKELINIVTPVPIQIEFPSTIYIESIIMDSINIELKQINPLN